MLLLHAGIHNGNTILWAERQLSPDQGEKESARAGSFHSIAKSTRSLQPFKLDKHPFGAFYDNLVEVLEPVAPDVRSDSARMATYRVWLPSSDGKPIPSSAMLVDDATFDRRSDGLTPWAVHGVLLRPHELASMFLAADNQHIFARGTYLANEFEFLSLCLRFAASLVVRQQYVPGIVEKDGLFYAQWQPTFIKDDRGHLAELAAMAPPVVRALEEADNSRHGPPNSAPLTVIKNYLAILVNDLVRNLSAPTKDSNDYDSVHDCWLSALTSDTGLMRYEYAEIVKFAAQLSEWQQPITALEGSHFRLCFRLEEPMLITDDGEPLDEVPPVEQGDELSFANNQSSWRVTFHLQDISDPSLLIAIKDAWSNRKITREKFAEHNFNPKEYLLLALGQAARLCPEINQSLHDYAPEGYALTDEGAYEFLTEQASALEQAGFGVMLPSWWRRSSNRLKLKAVVRPNKLGATSNLSLQSVMEFKWRAAIGDMDLTLEELVAIAELKTPLVKVRGKWVHVNSDDIAAAIAYLKRRAKSKASVRELLHMDLGAANLDGDIPVEVETSGWLGDLFSHLQDQARIEALPAPQGFDGELRGYQQRGFAWLAFLCKWGLGACLADDMGLGKTVQTLAMIQKERIEGQTMPVLLVCPTSVINNWVKEANRFTPGLNVLIHHGIKRMKGEELREAARQHAIVITSYSLLMRDKDDLDGILWSGVILDEAQNIKNSATKQAKAAREITGQYKVALTGTPVENSVGDLWSIMRFLNPDLLGSLTAFRKNFFVPIQVEKNAEVRERLRRITQPFILRRLKTDKSIITDLPEKQEMKVFCSLSKEQATLYTAVIKETDKFLKEAKGIERRGLVLKLMLHLKQICNHPANYSSDNSQLEGRSGKLERLVETLEEILEVKEKALIFTQFAEMGGLLKRHLEEKFGQEVLFLHGSVAKKTRDDMVERFQNADGPSIFVLSIKAGGIGLNLTAANHVFHYDRWWNPAVENQASDRAYRIGQQKTVQVRKFICAGTFEEKLDKLIESKTELAESIVGSGESWLNELSNDELRNIFALSKEALLE